MIGLTGADVPMPYAANLEEMCTPSVDNVINAIKKLLK